MITMAVLLMPPARGGATASQEQHFTPTSGHRPAVLPEPRKASPVLSPATPHERYDHYALTIRGVSPERVRKRAVYRQRLFRFLGPPESAAELFAKLGPETVGAFLADYALRLEHLDWERGRILFPACRRGPSALLQMLPAVLGTVLLCLPRAVSRSAVRRPKYGARPPTANGRPERHPKAARGLPVGRPGAARRTGDPPPVSFTRAFLETALGARRKASVRSETGRQRFQ
jgi:hypothetical protein